MPQLAGVIGQPVAVLVPDALEDGGGGELITLPKVQDYISV